MINNITKYSFAAFLLLVAIRCQWNTSDVNKTKTTQGIEDSLTIEYLAHASFLLHYDDHTLLLDPFADTVWLSYFFPRDIEADAIFSTHPHYDHDGGIFRDLKPYWQGTLPFYQEANIYQSGPFIVKGLKGKHCDPYGKEFGQINTIFTFEVGGLRLVHWGDNGPINDTLAAELSEIDILFLPIDDTFHILSKEDTKETIDLLNPKLIIPMHYRIDDLEPNEGKPKNLGSITEYFQSKDNVIRLPDNKYAFSKKDLPLQQTYMIFQHSPLIKGRN
jgi:L-ascorbate metabolism protein UlaG (beta-lactamase superfamily)